MMNAANAPNRRPARGWWLWALLVAGAPAGPVHAQTPAPMPATAVSSANGRLEALVKGANEAYNAQRYEQAQALYIEVIQIQPTLSLAYRNLARTYFWQNQYAAAVVYYDHFLQLSPKDAQADQIRSERRLAASRTGGQAWQLPDSQRQALTALQEELDEGRAYTAGGGGAWGLYRTLLRMGYAQPDLVPLRRRLHRRLVEEFEARLQPGPGQTAPELDLSDWEQQSARLSAARELAEDAQSQGVVERRAMVVSTAQSLLTGRSEHTADMARDALTQNVDLPLAHWFYVAALMQGERHEEALFALDELAHRLQNAGPAHQEYARVMRAALLQGMGRPEEAAAIYLDVLAR